MRCVRNVRGRAGLATSLAAAAAVAAAVAVVVAAAAVAAAAVVAGAAVVAAAVSPDFARAAGSGGSPWSRPAALGGCATGAQLGLAFPSSSPFAASGPGAIVFGGTATTCASRATAAPAAMAISPIGANDRPSAPRALTAGGVAVGGPAALTGTCSGPLVVVGALPAAGAGIGAGAGGGVALPAVAALVQGEAGRSFPPSVPLGGPQVPVAAAGGYLGDVAVASVAAGRVVVRVQRHFAAALGPPVVMSAGPARASAIAVGLDFRSDVIVAWEQPDGLFARELPMSGPPGPLQLLDRSATEPRITASISDAGRAIVAWTSEQPGQGGSHTASVLVDISGPAVRFGPSQVLERFREPPGRRLPAGAVRLTRLASENLMLGWTGMTRGRYSVRIAAVGANGVRRPVVTSPPGSDALLTDLVAGPRGEALALWTSPSRGARGAGAGPARILAARGFIMRPFRARFGPPEAVARAGRNGDPVAAYDPATDRAIAVWRVGGTRPVVDYAIRTGSGPAPIRAAPACPPAAVAGPAGGHGVRDALIALGGAALVALAAWSACRRRRRGRSRRRRQRR